MKIDLSKGQANAMLRCVADDFLSYYHACQDDPYADNSDNLDRMEEDLDLLEGLLPQMSNTIEGNDAAAIVIADFKRKLAECC